MQWQNNPYVIPMIVAGLISLINALVVAQRRGVPGSLPLLGMLLALSGWSFTYAFELASAKLEWQLFWAKIEYIGIVSVPTLYLLFTLEYARHKKVFEGNRIYWVWLFSIATVLLVWTSNSHQLYWTSMSQKDGGGFLLLSLEYGPAFFIWIAYSYISFLIGSIVLVRWSLISPPELKLQSYIIVLGAGISFVGNIIYLAGLSPIPNLDITPITLILSMSIYSIGLLRFGILDIMPIAGETILESLDDVVIVLDESNRIAYINQAFDYYINEDAKGFIGKPASVLPIWDMLSKLIASHTMARGEVVMNIDGREPAYFHTHISTVRWKTQRLGKAIILEDISERRRAERKSFGVSDDSLLSGDSIPVIMVLRAQDEKIAEVNRSFILSLGHERKDVVGKSPLQLGLWNAYERGEFFQAFRGTGFVKNHPLALMNVRQEKAQYLVSAHRMEVQDGSYIVMMANLKAE